LIAGEPITIINIIIVRVISYIPPREPASRLDQDLYTKNIEVEVRLLAKIRANRYPWRFRRDDDFIVFED